MNSGKDNGNGIPLVIMAKIFQSFFITIPAGKRTGLGLSSGHDTAEAHKGGSNPETKETEGTEFVILLPA